MRKLHSFILILCLLVVIVSGRYVKKQQNTDDSPPIPNDENAPDEEIEQETETEMEGDDNQSGEEEIPNQYEKEIEEHQLVHTATDINDDGDNVPNLFEVNRKAEKKQKDGVIKIPGHSGSHVDQGDIIFFECEEEERFGIYGNMENPKCTEILKKAKQRLAKNKKSHQKDIVTRANSTWQNPVPYTFENITKTADNFLGQFNTAFKYAIWDLQNATCLKFRKKRPSDSSWLAYERGIGCNSHVGKYGDGKHIINIQSQGCDSSMTITHETMHALGFWHEQSRTDRGNYVTINLANVDVFDNKNMSHNFNIIPDTDPLGYPYDYHSIMHYPRNAFGIEDVYKQGIEKPFPRETITPVDPNIGELGACQNCPLTEIDALQLNERYCNDPKNDLSMSDLTKVTERWIYIYRFHNHDVLPLKLVNHLVKLYPTFRFLVITSEEITGNKDQNVLYHCITVRNWRKDTTVCYTPYLRQQKRNAFNAARHHNRVKQYLMGEICNFQNIRKKIPPTEDRRRLLGFKYIPFGHQGAAYWNKDSNVVLVNFNCRSNEQATVVLQYE